MPEPDGVRILSRTSHEFLHEIPGEAIPALQREGTGTGSWFPDLTEGLGGSSAWLGASGLGQPLMLAFIF